MSRPLAVLAVLGLGSICAVRQLSAGDVPAGGTPASVWLGAATTDKGQMIQIHVAGLILETPSLTIKRSGPDVEIRPVNGELHLKSKYGDFLVRKTLWQTPLPITATCNPAFRSIRAIREDFEKSK
jgi:hypothetical protein